jgi:hypothetical protein
MGTADLLFAVLSMVIGFAVQVLPQVIQVIVDLLTQMTQQG